jgi:hypothetical protein
MRVLSMSPILRAATSDTRKTPMQTFLDARQLAHDKQIGGQQLHHQTA